MSCPAHAFLYEDWDDEPEQEARSGNPAPASWWEDDSPRPNYLPSPAKHGGSTEHALVRVAAAIREVAPTSVLQVAIEEARERFRLRSLESDDEGVATSPETLDRAIAFVRQTAAIAFERHGIDIDVPKILPGPDGSVDILWRSPRYDMLVNIPADTETLADFYGDKLDGLTIKGTFRPEIHHDGIVGWLTDRA